VIGTLIVQHISKNIERQETVLNISVTVKKEINYSNEIKQILLYEINLGGKLVPESLSTYHDVLLYSEAISKMSILEYDIIAAFNDYYKALIKCQTLRDYFQSALKNSNENLKATIDESSVYIVSINKMIEEGANLLKIIFNKYPKIEKSIALLPNIKKIKTVDLKDKKTTRILINR